MIDRETVINGLNHCFHGQECCGDTECPYYIEHLSDSCCLEDCQENLKANVLALLTEQEVKHGEWIDIWREDDPDTSSHARCSVCNRVSARPVGAYCKWCGAKMDDEVKGR